MNNTNRSPSLSPWAFRLFGWTASLACLITYAILVDKELCGIPPKSLYDGTFLWLGAVLGTLPFFGSVKIGDVFQLEREVGKTKADVNSLREQLHQSVAILGSNVSAMASLRTNVTTIVTQGATQPERINQVKGEFLPQERRQLPRSAMEMKILNTLWRHQVNKFPGLVLRFTFRIESPLPDEAAAYNAAIDKLVVEGLIARVPDGQVFLTNPGLQFCLSEYQTFPIDSWFNPTALDDEKLAEVKRELQNQCQ